MGMTEGEIDGTESEEPLTNNNKAQCIARRVRGIMMDNIKSSLDCMRDGFQLVSHNGSNRGNPQLDLTVHLAVRTKSLYATCVYCSAPASFAISSSLQ